MGRSERWLKPAGYLLGSPYFLPRSIVRGIRRHVREISVPIDIVQYYQRGKGLRSAISRHSATLISLALFLVILMKVYAVAKGNGQTMLALTRNISTAQVGAALIFGLSPYFFQFLYRVFDSIIESHRHPREVVVWFWIAYSVGVVLSALVLPFWLTLAAIAYPLFNFALHGLQVGAPEVGTNEPASAANSYVTWMNQPHADSVQSGIASNLRDLHARIEGLAVSDEDERHRLTDEINALIDQLRGRGAEIRQAMSSWNALRVFVGLGVAFYIVAAVLSSQPWLPLERVGARQGTVVGYVLRDDGAWTDVLEDETRIVRTLKSEEIINRNFCTREGNARSRTFMELIARKEPARYPKC